MYYFCEKSLFFCIFFVVTGKFRISGGSIGHRVACQPSIWTGVMTSDA